MTMPIQKPGRSKQDYGTPPDLLAAVQKRFGPIAVDLSARSDNAVCSLWISPETDSLSVDWTRHHGLLWLNPPYATIGPWAEKCAASAAPDRRIALLTPASIGARWFEQHVHHRALVLALTPRLTFVGCDAPYPKDCMLSVFGEAPGFDVWRWKP